VTLLLNILLAVALTSMTLWEIAALYLSRLLPREWRALTAAIFAAANILAFVLLPWPGRVSTAAFAIFAILLILFLRIPASNDRDWQPEVAFTPNAEIDGDIVTIDGVRNFDYRTESEFTPHWERRAYDLRKLDSADIIAVYWTGKAIAHIMLSFGFAGKDYLAVSIEARKEKGARYSTLAGFFRNYELYYVFADERDVLRVRTTYRRPQEDVYIYRLNGPVENFRRVFLDYVKAVNKLCDRPSFYNTLTTNCTTSILLHTRMNPESPPLSWKIFLSGYVPAYLYELGRLDTAVPFAQLEKLSRVNERAHAADRDSAFSQRIREGSPMPSSPASGSRDGPDDRPLACARVFHYRDK